MTLGLTGGTATPVDFTPQRIGTAALRDLAALVEVNTDAATERWSSRVALHYADGRTREAAKAEESLVKVLQSAKQRPSPIDGYFGGVYYTGPIFSSFRGTEDAVDYYKLLTLINNTANTTSNVSNAAINVNAATKTRW